MENRKRNSGGRQREAAAVREVDSNTKKVKLQRGFKGMDFLREGKEGTLNNTGR